MISTRSPGKIAKCGWFSNIFAAASCEAARTTVKAPSSLAMSVTPLPSTFLVLPSGPPISRMAPWCFSTHAFQAAMPSRSFFCRWSAGSASHAAILGLVLLPRKTARYVSLLMGFSFAERLTGIAGLTPGGAARLQFREIGGHALHLLRIVGDFVHLADFDDFVGRGRALLRPIDRSLTRGHLDHPVASEHF